MIDPRYCRCDVNPNNVASIWLLRGNAGAVMVRNCDGSATTAFCSKGRRFFVRKTTAYPDVFVDGAGDPVQSSPKSDRGSTRVRQEEESREDK
jgi:hypothetical protein